MTRLYRTETGAAPLPESLAETLPRWRRERLCAVKNPTARRESLCAGLLLSHVLRLHGLDPDEPVTVLPAGKPVFAGREDVFFSLSHSGGQVLCALSDRPVGADVQQVREARLTVARWFHPEERRWLDSLPAEERQAGLFRLWTRKEAWVKAVSAERMMSLSEADVIHGLPGLYFRDYAIFGGCAAAICGADFAQPDKIHEIPLQELLAGV